MKNLIVAGAILMLLTGYSQLNAQEKAASEKQEKKQEDKKESKKKDPLLNPDLATEKAPAKFRVKFATTKGDFVLECTREWAPKGVDRFYNLVKIGYYKDIAIFRAIDGFMFQFGIHGDPKVSKVWREAKIDDDPSFKNVSNQAGYITYATAGRDTRTTQLFINLGDNSGLDTRGFVPFGKVVSGMDIVKKVNTEYGENHRRVQGRFQAEGNAYIKEEFPKIDFIKSVTLIKEKSKDGKEKGSKKKGSDKKESDKKGK